MSSPQIQTQITHIGGLEIIARELATGPHPHPDHGGRIVPFKNVYKGILENDTEVIFCGTCGHVGPSTQSVASHRSGAHPTKPRGPGTPVETIRGVLRAVNLAKKTGFTGYRERAAEILNQEGKYRPVRGGTWTAGSVGNIQKHYRDTYRVRNSRPAEPAPTVTRQTMNAGLDVGKAIDALRTVLKDANDLLSTIERTAGQADPELARKAAKWDQAKQLFGLPD